MLKNPLKEEQAAMKTRWSDPAYRWGNDSALRRRYLKETNANATRLPVQAPRHDVETVLCSGSGETEQVAKAEGETK